MKSLNENKLLYTVSAILGLIVIVGIIFTASMNLRSGVVGDKEEECTYGNVDHGNWECHQWAEWQVSEDVYAWAAMIVSIFTIIIIGTSIAFFRVESAPRIIKFPGVGAAFLTFIIGGLILLIPLVFLVALGGMLGEGSGIPFVRIWKG